MSAGNVRCHSFSLAVCYAVKKASCELILLAFLGFTEAAIGEYYISLLSGMYLKISTLLAMTCRFWRREMFSIVAV